MRAQRESQFQGLQGGSPAGQDGYRCCAQEAPRGQAACTKRVTGPPSCALLGQEALNVSATREPKGAAGWFACRPGRLSVLRA